MVALADPDAYAVCLRIARRHYENFPVASALLPRPMRPHIAAIYAFARTADDFADEGERTDQERVALLDNWERSLESSIHRSIESSIHRSIESSIHLADAEAVFAALGETIRTFDLDIQLFADLLSAFRQDVLVKRYDTWDALVDYCRRSANPIGRLVLRVAGRRDPALDAASDALCTALQLVNFWQDLERDWAAGRLYVPASIVQAAAAREEDLAARRFTPAWQRALSDAAARTRPLFETGRAVADGVGGRLAWELRATWLGGMRVLDRLEAAGFDVFTARPSLGWRDGAAILWRTLWWKRRASGDQR